MSDAIKIKCPKCGEEIELSRGDNVRDVECPACFEKFPMPDVEAEPPTAGHELESRVEPTRSDEAVPVAPSGEPGPSAEADSSRLSYINSIVTILMQKGHRLLGAYFIVNIFVSIGILYLFYGTLFIRPETAGGHFLTLCLAVVTFCAWLMVMVSPLGEMYFRRVTGCNEIRRHEDIDRVMPIFENVCNAARKVNPSLPHDIAIFMSNDKAPNAFAVGRKTVCVTKGLVLNPNVSPRCVEAVLAHELGHLTHRDTDITLLLSVGNVLQDIFFKVLHVIASVLTWIFTIIGAIFGALLGSALGSRSGSDGDAGGGLANLVGRLLHWIMGKIIELWQWIVMVIMRRASRNDEFHADEFSFNCGYGNELCWMFGWFEHLQSADEDAGPQGMFRLLESTHPPLDERIAHLQDMGATYRRVDYSDI